MAVENITLNLIPTGDKPSIHVAQFDVDRPFTVTLKEGEDDFTPTDYDIELQVRKVDNNIVTVIPTQISGNVVTFNTTEQMTACSGTNLAELQLSKDSQTFATLHFYLVVQRDVLAGGVTSESDIYNLTEQIAAIVPEVIGDDYYNKEEVDEKIAEIPTFDPTNYYDKSDVDTLLNGKADISDLPDMTNYYNKSQTDALLNDKADVSDLPDMSDYYTKSEVDTKITDLTQIKTASGSLVHITDGGNDIPVKSLESEIVAVESGNGEKSPTNPYTISGWSNGLLAVTDNTDLQYISGLLKGAYDCADLTSLTWTYNSGNGFLNTTTDLPNSIQSFGGVPNAISGVELPIVDASQLGNVNKGWTIYNRRMYLKNTALSEAELRSLLVGNYVIYKTVSTIQPTVTKSVLDGILTSFGINGNSYEFAFGQTVYGGHFDNKGNLVVTHNYIASYNGETINEPWVSSMDNYVPNTSPSTGAQVVYPLDTPITLSITSQNIPTLSGENNISSNTGDIEVQYFTEKSDGIAELIKAFM